MFKENFNCSIDPGKKAVCEKLLEYDGIAKLFEMQIIKMDKSYSKIQMDFKDEFKNAVGYLHGASVFALCDFAYAVASAKEGEVRLNVSSHISFLNAGKIGPFTAECCELNEGHKISNFEVKVYDGEQKLIATCQITGYKKSGLNPSPNE